MWRKTTSAPLTAVITVLLMSAFIFSGSLAQDSAPTSIPTNTALPSATPTDLPTATPLPTNTPAPTATIAPTNTPLPTATTAPTNPPTATALPTETPVPTTGVSSLILASTELPAATATTAVTAITPLVVAQSEPSQITAGQGGTLSLIGANFSADTTVRLVGYGFLKTTLINAGSLTAALPADIPVGSYVIQVSDPVHGGALAPGALTVVAAPVTATPAATVTEVPGQPKLVVRGFSASPQSIYPGGTTQLAFEVVNVGSRKAEGVVVSLGDGKFTPASGQASLTLADIFPSAYYDVTFAVVAPADASEGPASIPLVLSSRDESGKTYTDNAMVSVNIIAKPALASQVVLKSYTVKPDAATPGETVSVQAVIANTGNETATQVLVQLSDTNAVLIAGSQGNSFAVGELKAKASKTITMPLIVANDAKSDIQAQTFTISYLQASESKQATASISLEIKAKEARLSQVVLGGYTVTPNQARPGETVSVQAVIKNTGNEAASQVLVQLTDTNAVLIAGLQGNSFTVGDLEAGASKTITMPLIVANDAKSGVQAQAFTISYLQESESKQATGSISLDILPAVEESPVLLLQSYSTGQDNPLEPGQQFTYKMILQNAGKEGVSNLLVTFGTVKEDTTTAVSTSTTTASTNFAPIGSGDTVFVGDLAADQTATVSQGFIVNSDVTSGIFNLPITLQYRLPDGSTTQQTLNANLVVIVPSRLRVSLTTALPDTLTAGQTYSLSIKVANLGTSKAAVSKMHITGENVTITEGADALLDPLASEDNTTKSASIQAKATGSYKLTIAVEYIDELNRSQTYSTTLSGEVSAPAAPQMPVLPAQQPQQDQNLLERLFLGFLGLGG